MEEKKTTTEQWVEGIENIAETYRSLITVRVVEQTSLGATLSFLGIIFLMFTICILIFLGLGTAWWVGKELNNPAGGTQPEKYQDTNGEHQEDDTQKTERGTK